MKKVFKFLIVFLFIFMAIETWGGLQKTSTDPTTIDEAIQTAIDNHNADPSAHNDAGGALQNHKSDSVIDHPAFSVVGDKVALDRNVIDINMPDFANFDVSSGVELNGISALYFHSANSSSPQWFYAFEQDTVNASYFAASLFPRFTTNFMVSSDSFQLGYIIVGERDEGRGFGIKISDNKLQAIFYKSDHTQVVTDILTLTAYHVYKIDVRVVSLTHIEFWVDNVLALDLESSDIPSDFGDYVLGTPWIDFKATTSSEREMWLRTFHFEADFPVA